MQKKGVNVSGRITSVWIPPSRDVERIKRKRNAKKIGFAVGRRRVRRVSVMESRTLEAVVQH